MNDLNVFSGGNNGTPALGAASMMMLSRQAQEVQAAMVVAKKFPRDERYSADRILSACSRETLAKDAMYEYPRGGETITGPSIRLAEALAQNWGNIDFGVIELEQKNGESQVMSYAWDLETNTRQSKIFTVPHVRQTKKGSYPLTDPRDIYEMVANQGARRLRACILGVIPGDVVDMAMRQCELTLKSNKAPLDTRIKNMVDAFQNDFGVGPDALRNYIGKNVDAFSETDVIRLGKVYRSLKDGVIGSDYFIGKLQTPPEEPGTIQPAAQQEDQVSLNDV